MEGSGLLSQLEQLLSSELPGTPFQRCLGADRQALVFQSPSREVGELYVCEDREGLVVFIGEFMHLHWIDVSKAKTARNVLYFLREVFEDRVEFYGNARAGGCRPVGKPRGWLSRLVSGHATYRWSGPTSAGQG